MSEFEQQLIIDQNNVELSKETLRAIEPQALALIDLCMLAVRHLSDEYGRICDYNGHQERLERAIGLIPGFSVPLLDLLCDAALVGDKDGADPVADAVAALLAELNIVARALLCLRVGRELVFSLSDLLRLRISASLGVLRTQAETVALLRMLGKDANLGRKWLATVDDSRAKDFHRVFHGTVVENIRELGLEHDYNRGSNMSLHPRASGIAYGYLLGGCVGPSADAVTLTYQETGTPEGLLFWYCIHMRFYRLVLEKARLVIPELGPEFITHEPIAQFLALEGDVRNRAGAIIKKADAEGRWALGA